MAVTFTQARKSTCNLGELVSFSGGFSPLDTSGLMPFEGTVTILPPDRGNSYCWGQEVVINVSGMGSGWLPKLFIKSISPLDIKTGELSVNVGCAISLLANKTFEDFKEEEDFLIVEGEEGEEVDTERFWWQQWELLQSDIDAGIIKDVTIISIVQEICRHLNLPCSGGVSGKKRLPYTPGGTILSEIGTLIFNSDKPSYAYADHRGVMRITPIDLSPSSSFSIQLGQSELDKDYNPIDSGIEPIERLIVTYVLKELEDECDKTLQRCYTSSHSVPGMDITGNPDHSYEVETEITTTCEWVVCNIGPPPFRRLPNFKDSGNGLASANVKATKTTKKAVPEYIFPESSNDLNIGSLTDSYFELKNEYYDAVDGILRVEVVWKQEPIGIVFGGWLKNHEHWDIGDQLASGMGNTIHDFNYALVVGRGPVDPPAMPGPGRAGDYLYDMTLTDSEYSETFYYYDDTNVLTGKVTMTWIPINKVMPDFNGNGNSNLAEAYVDFEVPPDNKSQYNIFSIEILEKDGWVDLRQITTPNPDESTQKRAYFNVWYPYVGGIGAFTSGTVLSSIVTETWKYDCAGNTVHMVEEKSLQYNFSSEIESNLQSKYAEPINVVLNVTTYNKIYRPPTDTTPAIPVGAVLGRSKSTITTENPHKFLNTAMWGTKQEAFDEYLSRNNLDEYTGTGGIPIPDDWVLVGGSDGYVMNYNNTKIIPNFLSRHTLLKLVTTRTVSRGSAGGNENPASSEYLSCAITDAVKWKNVPGVLTIDGFLCTKGRWEPPTEVMDLGEIYDVSYARKLANIIMDMRQAQAIQYELICKLDPQVCGFPPVRTIRVKESCQTNADLVFVGNSQGITIGSDEMVVSWDLWQIGYKPGVTDANWVYPPEDYIISDGTDGPGIVIAPPPQYVVVPNNYDGKGVITIGSDTLQGTIVYTPNYVDVTDQGYTNGTWVTIVTGDNETLNGWVENGKVEIPNDIQGSVTIVVGDDTLSENIIDVPDRVELPLGYYPSGNVLVDDTLSASLESDDTIPVYTTNPMIPDGDDTLIDSWPEILGVGGIARLFVQSPSDYLSYGLGMRKIMIRGDET